MSKASLTQTLQEKLREDSLKNLSEREGSEQANRMRLREFVTRLREPGEPYSLSPASTSTPSFKVGDVHNFPYVSERGAETPGAGHLSAPASKEFFEHLKTAASKPDPASRDASMGRAAKVVANDWGLKHGKEGVTASVLHEARAQAVFVSRELGAKLGLGPVESAVFGHSLERALEKEGFKVFANHAIDKISDAFRATSSSTALATGMRHNMESALTQSMNWMASHGVTKEALKNAVSKHSGKFVVLAQLADNPEVVQRAAQVLAHSDKALNGVIALAKDDEFRKAVGNVTLATGEAVAGIHKGAGSVAILAGAALKGESTDDMGRHAFRAALSIVGGAAGGLAGGGVASIATATLGASAGSWVADKVLEVWDKQFNNGQAPAQQKHVTAQELQESKQTLADRTQDVARRMQSSGTELAKEHGRDMEREYTLQHKPKAS